MKALCNGTMFRVVKISNSNRNQTQYHQIPSARSSGKTKEVKMAVSASFSMLLLSNKMLNTGHAL